MNIKLLTEQHLEFLSLKGGCTGSSESTLVKMTHCWKSHVKAQIMSPEQTGYVIDGIDSGSSEVLGVKNNKLSHFSSIDSMPGGYNKIHALLN